jgi:branched-chain amino acid transport system permease protein
MGFSLLFGVMRIANFAQGDIYMLGAYMGYFSYEVLHLSPILCVLVALLGGFIFGCFIEKIGFSQLRKRGSNGWLMNVFLLTGGMSFVIQNLAIIFLGARYRGVESLFNGSVLIGNIGISYDRLFAMAMAVITLVVFWIFLKKTKTGNAIWAVSENEVGATLMGINLKQMYRFTVGISFALAALAGTLLISITPAYPTIGLVPQMKAWYVIILVGMGNIGGTVVGGLIVAAVESLALTYLGTLWQDVTCFVMIILILILKPNGIFGKKMKV